MASRAAWIVLLSCLAAGCGLLLDLDPGASGGTDGPGPDGGVVVDGATGSVDAGFVPSCTTTPEGDLVALYRFDGSLAEESGAAPDGIDEAPTRFVDGPPGCGSAIAFAPRLEAETGYVVVPHANAWDLSRGSIDLWVRIDERGGAGILSRDAIFENEPGHFSLMATPTGQLAVRIQRLAERTNVAVCTADPVPLGRWVHVGIQFGPEVHLFIDGRRDDAWRGELDTKTYGIVLTCGAGGLDRSIAGNFEPWVIGAGAWTSMEGSATPTDGPFVGAVDHLRIWRSIVRFE